MAERPIPNGYYAMTVDELYSFIRELPEWRRRNATIQVEIDGQCFPVIKIVRGFGDSIVVRVPSERL
jgi:hypothetical protein